MEPKERKEYSIEDGHMVTYVYDANDDLIRMETVNDYVSRWPESGHEELQKVDTPPREVPWREANSEEFW